MKAEEELKNKYGQDAGYRVPVNYFADLEANIMQQLPPYPKSEPQKIVTRWQRIKPYVYLAAMFCGIWLMMKVFHTATQPLSMSLDNPPEALVEMLNKDIDYDYHIIPFRDEYDAEDEELIMSYDSIDDFKKDFYNL